MKITSLESIVAAFLLALTPVGTAAFGEEAAGDSPPPGYAPGLGEIMSAIQLRHAKLWFAGKAKNWPLAGYELDELKEGFDDAAKLHPEHNGRPIAGRIGALTAGPMEHLERAVKDRDPARFVKAYDELSQSCTSCHRGSGCGFIRIGRPTVPPWTNQRFDLEPQP